jgi:hypothetical protein
VISVATDLPRSTQGGRNHGGIAIRAGAVAVITGNEITDHYSLVKDHGAAGFSVGIFLVAADPKTNPHLLQDNVFQNNQLNVQRVR